MYKTIILKVLIKLIFKRSKVMSSDLLLSFTQTPVKSEVNNVRNYKGLFLVGVTGGVSIVLSVICYPFISPALRKICLPYVPATSVQVQNVLRILKGRSGKLVDLGSGDGRIVIESAKKGFESVGVELNYWLILYSRLISLLSNIKPRPKFIRSDLWKYNLKPFPNVVIFGVDEMMLKLEEKFNMELNDGAVVIACRFPLPNLVPYQVIGTGIDKVWAYKISKNKTQDI
ncbi:ATP synthase subunit C lysine N-methyltransferase isoform X1 [Daktulosphaira vitifoliae]|uniref:ATP synthase subunit C lysine N-methyltransferase isoform X1 n=1 Tax=Daktulosphaira vitifoliae TaxID=58002 RepID=UPI0021A9A992|nr:ATP synthase subunit C lysine N-methyltransferase isoform X1 [Daktulosphaira vitifoliae]